MKTPPHIPTGGIQIAELSDLIPYLLPADVGFSHGRGWVSRAICKLTQAPKEPATYANHTFGLGWGGSRILEALWRVTSSPVGEWDQPPEWEIWRHLYLSWERRERIAARAEQREGQPYGPLKILGHYGDALLTEIRGREICFFRQLCFLEDYPICSWLWGEAYDSQQSPLGKVDYRFASPDDQHDWCCRIPSWAMVAKRYPSGQIYAFNAVPRGKA